MEELFKSIEEQLKTINIGDKIRVYTDDEILVGRLLKNTGSIIRLEKATIQTPTRRFKMKEVPICVYDINKIDIIQRFYKY